MKKIVILIGLVIIMIISFLLAAKAIDYYSIASKNTRAIEHILFQDTTAGKAVASGKVKDLIPFDYDKMFVFEPYQSKEAMEKQIGFKYSKLHEGLSEGIINILFVKDNSAVAYLFGYSSNSGYYINVPVGEYTKAQLDKMNYTTKKNEVGNSAGTPKTYMNYVFKD